MRVFLIQTAKGLFASSGGYKSNISFLRYLASRGHTVGQLCFTNEEEVNVYMSKATEAQRRSVIRSELQVTLPDNTVVTIPTFVFVGHENIHMVGLDIQTFNRVLPEQVMTKETADFLENSRLTPRLRAFIFFIAMHLTVFRPTHVIFNDALSLKLTSLLPQPIRRICIIHTAEQLPFGPFTAGIPGSACSPAELPLLRKIDGIWSVSKAIQDYALKYGQLKTTFHYHHPWTYLDPHTHAYPPRYYNWDKPYIGVINPSGIKGFPVFEDLAKACPNLKFATWCSWGTNDKIKECLKKLPNVDVHPTTRNPEEIFSKLKVLLVPSLWLEAWGLVVVEAQLRGIPVIASNQGGLPEAKLGVPHIVPVTGITGERKNGEYILPEQDPAHILEWKCVLEKLVGDRSYYEDIAETGVRRSKSWLESIGDDTLEKWLLSMTGETTASTTTVTTSVPAPLPVSVHAAHGPATVENLKTAVSAENLQQQASVAAQANATAKAKMGFPYFPSELMGSRKPRQPPFNSARWTPNNSSRWNPAPPSPTRPSLFGNPIGNGRRSANRASLGGGFPDVALQDAARAAGMARRVGRRGVMSEGTIV